MDLLSGLSGNQICKIDFEREPLCELISFKDSVVTYNELKIVTINIVK